MKALVLAAGFATRLWPLTRERAKPLLAVGGRAALEYALDAVLATGEVEAVTVVHNHRFAGEFAAWARGWSRGVPLALVDDGATTPEQRLGAVRDLALGWDAAGGAHTDLVALAGDNVIEGDLAPAFARFRARRRPTILVRRLASPPPPRTYSDVELSPDGTVRSFHEKPDEPRSKFSALALYLLPADARADLARYLAQGGEPDAPGHWLAWLAGEREVDAVPFAGRYLDIGAARGLTAARDRYGRVPAERRQPPDAGP